MAILNGTSLDDVINGTTADDTIEGLAGNDLLYGHEGHDILRGGDGYDSLSGGEGNDVIEGGGFADSISDGYGDDLVDGGEGNDYIDSNQGGDDVLIGGDGDDYFGISHGQSGDHVEVDGGSGNDRVWLFDSFANEHVLDMGAGDDRVTVTVLRGATRVTLGEGRDLIELHDYFGSTIGQGGSVAVADFVAGNLGDRVEFLELMPRYFTNWNHASSPFATGHARLPPGFWTRMPRAMRS